MHDWQVFGLKAVHSSSFLQPDPQSFTIFFWMSMEKPSSLKRRILIIDDDESICTLLRTFFESIEYEVTTCMSPVGIFQDLESLHADVILLDVMMSWVDGFRVCELLKSHPHTKNIPVLMISARSRKEDIQRGLAAQAADYITKPFDLSRLRGRIEEILALEDIAN